MEIRDSVQALPADGVAALVVSFDRSLSLVAARELEDRLRQVLADSPLAAAPILLLDAGVRLHVVRTNGMVTGTTPVDEALAGACADLLHPTP